MTRGITAAVLLLLAQCADAETLAGRLAWLTPLEVSTPRSGMVTEVLVAPGDRVAEGAVLARLEMRGVRARLAAAQSGLRAAQAAREEAGRERERTRELYDRTLLSDHDLQLAQIALIEAQAAQARAQQTLIEAQLELDYSELRAPFPALVLEVGVQPGQTVANRVIVASMVTITRSDALAVRAMVNPERAASLAVGQTLRVRVGGRDVEGVVTDPGLRPDPDADTLHYHLEVRLPWPADATAWRAGQPAEIVLP